MSVEKIKLSEGVSYRSRIIGCGSQDLQQYTNSVAQMLGSQTCNIVKYSINVDLLYGS